MRNREFIWLFIFMALLALITILSGNAHGQEVIMNQPSADIVDKGHVFVRADEFYTQAPATYDENLNLALGLGHNLEVSLNGVNAFNRAASGRAFLVPGFKYAPIKTKNFELYVGDQVYKPVSGPGFTGNNTYEGLAYKVGDFRFTGGSFQSHDALAAGNRAGGFGGIEYGKMVSKNWMLGPGVDYASGAGTNGYVSPGLMFSYKMNLFICPGYMIANKGNPNGAHQSFVMIGRTF
jgi:hypothetical protein